MDKKRKDNMNHHEIILALYKHMVNLMDDGKIPIDLRAPSLVGTVQDDPFDCWVEVEIKKALPGLEVVHSGSLTTPDILIRNRTNGAIAGLEVKKLIQKPSGADSRGLTIDYNSCIPCGQALVKVGKDTVAIPCYYLYCLLDPNSQNIVTMILMDGDFINYDFNLHKKAKIANVSEYNHGPYGEGSVRRRAMYTYPNPLNHKLKFFHLRKILVIKKFDAENLHVEDNATHLIRRDDLFDNSFHYFIIDNSVPPVPEEKKISLTDVFIACKKRKPKKRTSSYAKLESL